jgi:hypothetical protein
MDLGTIGYTVVVEGEEAARAAVDRFVRDQGKVVTAAAQVADSATANANRAAAATEKAIQREIASYEKLFRTIAQAERAYDNLLVTMVPQLRIHMENARQIDVLNNAYKTGVVGITEYERAMALLESHYDNQQEKERAAGLELEAAAAREVAEANKEIMNSYNAVTASLNPLIAAEMQYMNALDAVNQASSSGLISKSQGLSTKVALRDQYETQSAAPYLRDMEMVQRAQEETRASNARLAEQVDRLGIHMSRAYRDVHMYQNAIETLDYALWQGVISQEVYAQRLQQTRAHMLALGATFDASGKIIGGSDAGFSRWARGGIQQAGYQIADFAVQMQMGTSFLVAFGQQGSQLVSTFGQWGAMAGAAIAIFAALGTVILQLTKDTRDFDDVMQDFEKSMQRVRDTMDIIGDSNLDERFGTMADNIRSIAEDFKGIDIRQSLEETISLIDEIVKKTEPSGYQQWFLTMVDALSGGGGGPQSFGVGPEQSRLTEYNAQDTFDAFGFAESFTLERMDEMVAGIKAAATSGDAEATAVAIEAMMREAMPTGEDLLNAVSGGGLEFFQNLRDAYSEVAETVSSITGSGLKAETKGEHQEELQDALDTYREISVELLGQNSILEAQSRFGEDSKEARKAVLSVERLAYELGLEADGLSSNQIDSLMTMFDWNTKITEEMRVQNEEREQMAEYKSSVSSMQRENDLLRTRLEYGEDSVQLREAELNVELDIIAAELRKKKYTQDQINVILDLVRAQRDHEYAIEQGGKAFDTMDSAVLMVYAHINDSKTAMELLAAMEPDAGWLQGAINAASLLAGNLWSAVNAFNTFATSTAAATRGPAGMGELPLVLTPDDGIPSLRPEARPAGAAIDWGIPEEAKSGGGGGTEEEDDPLKDLIERIKLEETLLGMSEARIAVEEAIAENRSDYTEAEIDAAVAYIDAYNKKLEVIEREQEIMDEVADSMSDAFMDMIEGTESVEEAFRSMAYAIIKELYNVMIVQQMVGSWNATSQTGTGITGWLGQLMSAGISGLTGAPAAAPVATANGNAFENGYLTAFAGGGVVDSPTLFPMRNGAGLMGEAGPEAILPLKRGADGKLGVSADGKSGGDIVVHNTFTISGSDEATVARALNRALPSIVEATTSGVMDARSRGGRMKAVFGG